MSNNKNMSIKWTLVCVYFLKQETVHIIDFTHTKICELLKLRNYGNYFQEKHEHICEIIKKYQSEKYTKCDLLRNNQICFYEDNFKISEPVEAGHLSLDTFFFLLNSDKL